jgi:transcriptional regulator with XRE-family HTH domain
MRDADRATGIPYATWSNVETREGHDPQLSTVQRLADALGVDVCELVSAPVFPDGPAPAEPAEPDIPADPGRKRAKRGRRRDT